MQGVARCLKKSQKSTCLPITLAVFAVGEFLRGVEAGRVGAFLERPLFVPIVGQIPVGLIPMTFAGVGCISGVSLTGRICVKKLTLRL
jgi:hypothetical protein